ncbi:hypothetical protein NBRC110019_25200 [Neptunitalea chrysea]|uniref:CAAX prenyl protease 2/Lysostaphin resistance protein A-like domain-containing protein n=1 Tax=Neptunitalea chrysea TaxID=1647581 RepID=A0A9W6EV76_9FLAO|nr:CPBP family intramembrane glutamic endopeptidase [Neptunitalea chrysea]GLB53479.1 hypothetical protein NBRC110019_25200 [Neptunitalea chrysea]
MKRPIMKNTYRIILIVAIAFIVYVTGFRTFFSAWKNSIDLTIGSMGVSHIICYVLMGIPLFTGTLLITKGKGFFTGIGLKSNAIKGILITLGFTLPMGIGSAIFFNFNNYVKLDTILIGAVAAAFFEELYFRGFLFGLIFKNTKIGFIPAIFLGAVLFAMGHLYQSNNMETLIGIFTMTFMGAILFAWLYCEWNYNLWVAIGMHFWMNLFWMLFSVSEDALGDTMANVFRFTTIALAIGFTVIYKLKKGKKLEINRYTIWMKK